MPFVRAADGLPSELALPRPAQATWPFLALALVPLSLGIAGVIPALGGLELGAACAAAAVVRAGRAWRRLVRLRNLADQHLLGGARPGSSPLLAWRSGELTATGNRRVLARTLRGIVGELDRRLLPSASPLNRMAARPHTELIQALAERLGRLERPIPAAGVLHVERLLTQGSGPLYSRARAEELGPTLARCLAALDANPDALDDRGERELGIDGNGHPQGADRKLVGTWGKMR